jgi:hypothetical protein
MRVKRGRERSGRGGEVGTEEEELLTPPLLPLNLSQHKHHAPALLPRPDLASAALLSLQDLLLDETRNTSYTPLGAFSSTRKGLGGYGEAPPGASAEYEPAVVDAIWLEGRKGDEAFLVLPRM